jgi:hypothetical protein
MPFFELAIWLFVFGVQNTIAGLMPKRTLTSPQCVSRSTTHLLPPSSVSVSPLSATQHFGSSALLGQSPGPDWASSSM